MEQRTQIYLEKKQHQFLKEQSEKQGISLAQAIRNLIQKEMPSEKFWEEDPIWKIDEIPFNSGEKNASARHHEILWQRLQRKRTRHE